MRKLNDVRNVALLALAFGALGFLASCQTAPVLRQPVKAPPAAEQDYKQARAALDKGDQKKAVEFVTRPLKLKI